MNKTAVSIIAIIVVIGGGWYMLRGTPVSAPETPTADQTPVTTTATTNTTTTTTSTGVTIVYTDQGFSPNSVTIPLGTAVTFVNQSSKTMWVASAAHPTHMVYSGTNVSQHCPDTTNTAFDECQADVPGATFTFTFTKVGTWGYHNHGAPGDKGSVIVTEATAPAPI